MLKELKFKFIYILLTVMLVTAAPVVSAFELIVFPPITGANPFTPSEEKYIEEYKAKKWRMHTAIHNFRSWFSEEQFSFLGVKGGLEYKKRYRFGIMLLAQQEAVVFDDADPDVDYELSEVGYIAGYGEYMIVNNYRWELGIPVSFGRGGGRLITLDQQNEQIGEPEERVFSALQLGLYGQYNINYWLGVGLGAGHRKGFSGDIKVEDFVSAPYYTFGLKINLGRFLKSVFAHDKVKAEKKLYFESRKRRRL